MARRDIMMIKQFSSASNKSSTTAPQQQPQFQDALTCRSSQEASGLSASCGAIGAGGGGGGDETGAEAGCCDFSDHPNSEQLKSPTITIGPCTSSSSTTITNTTSTSNQIRNSHSNNSSIKHKQRRQLSFNTETEISGDQRERREQRQRNSKVNSNRNDQYDNQFRQNSARLTLPRPIISSSSSLTDRSGQTRNNNEIIKINKKQQIANLSSATTATATTTIANPDQSRASSEPRFRPNSPTLRYPNLVSPSQRLQAPRMSLLGKPIYLSSHKSKYRNTPSMRWKMRLRSFLEQPQGLLPWLYHFSL